MKRFLILLMIPLLLAACAPDAPDTTINDAATAAPAVVQSGTPVPTISGVLATDFEDAANVRNQLALGTLKLEGTAQAITPEQAKTLLPLWQAMVALTGDQMAVPEEMDALDNQLLVAMTPEQLKAIDELQITSAAVNEFYASKGIVLPTLAPGVTRNPGAMRSLPEADREATRAAMQASGTSGGGQGMGQSARTVLYDEVITLLNARTAE